MHTGFHDLFSHAKQAVLKILHVSHGPTRSYARMALHRVFPDHDSGQLHVCIPLTTVWVGRVATLSMQVYHRSNTLPPRNAPAKSTLCPGAQLGLHAAQLLIAAGGDVAPVRHGLGELRPRDLISMR